LMGSMQKGGSVGSRNDSDAPFIKSEPIRRKISDEKN
jgi:hypothetical protein